MSLSCSVFRVPSPALIVSVPSPTQTEKWWMLHQAHIRTSNHQASLWVLLALHQPPNHWPLFWVLVSLLVLSSCTCTPSLSALERTEWRMTTEEREVERLPGSGSGTGSGCKSLGDSEPAVLVSEGQVVIGGLFPLHYVAPEPQHSYRNKPEHIPCSGFDHRAFRWVMTMVFAVEEINRNSTLLPGVKLGYRILDSCDHVHTSLRGALSLVTDPFSEKEIMEERMEERGEGGAEGGTAEPRCLEREPRKEQRMEERLEERMEGRLEERMAERGGGGTEGTEAQPWCLAGAPVSAVIGLASSSPTRAVAQTLGPFGIPLVSYFATCTCLTDKSVYPSFLRTVPSDLFQVRGLVQLVTHFGWRWVGTVGTQDDYSRYGIQAFSRQLKEQGGCLAFHLTIPSSPLSPAGLQALADRLQSSSARVIVVFATEGQLLGLLSELALRNLTGIQWVASEAWVTASLLTSPHFHPVLEGTLGFSFPGVSIPGLGEFLSTVRPSPRPGSELVNLFWEELFGCRLEFGEDSIRGNANGSPIEDGGGGNPLDSPLEEDGDGSRLNLSLSSAGEPMGTTRDAGGRGSKSAGGTPVCTGSEDLRDTESSYTDASQVRISYNVYKAVYVIAHALHRLLQCDSTVHSQDQGRCQTSTSFTPRQLLHYMKRVNFTNHFGEKVHFDSNGEPVPLYDIINWQRDGSGSIRFQKVGSYDGSAPLGQQLLMKESAIVWMGGQSQVPVSLCSAPCLPGSRQARRPGEPSCCFDCLPCADGQISNQTGSTECTKCPEFFWSDRDRVNCVAGVEDFLSIHETMGAILVSLSLLGVVTTTVITTVFHRFRSTAIVKANNSELSFLLLLSLKLCFLCSLVFIGRPSVWACRFRQAAFGVSFVLCLSCLLVKTIVVLLAFRANLPGCSSLKLFGPPQQRILILCTTAPQVCLCAGWLSLASPFPFKNTSYQGTTGKVVLECKEPWAPGFPLVLGYIGLLASLCLLLAFLGRKLPDTFNEAKLITFSMLIFCAVWITFIPAYVSSPGKYTVAVEIFAILASSFGLLLCIFAPKCYIILLQPERNTKKGITGKPSRLT